MSSDKCPVWVFSYNHEQWKDYYEFTCFYQRWKRIKRSGTKEEEEHDDKDYIFISVDHVDKDVNQNIQICEGVLEYDDWLPSAQIKILLSTTCSVRTEM